MEFPKDWRQTSIGEACEPRRELIVPSVGMECRYVGLEHIEPGRISLNRWGFGADVRSAKSKYAAGDILYGKLRPYLDKAVVADNDGICSTDILVLRANEEVTTPHYLGFLLHSRPFVEYAVSTTEGVNLPRTSWQSISRYSCALPSVGEQRAIAGVLARLQAAMAVEEKRIAALKELKAATMAKLFREGTRGEKLKQTDLGEIPESWDVVPIGSIARVGNGSTPSRQNELYWMNGSIPWITSSKVHEILIYRADNYVTPLAKEECHLPTVNKGNLVVAITGQGKTLGNVAIIEFDTCINQHLAYIQPTNQQVNSYYLLAYLQTRYHDFRQTGTSGGTTKGALTCGFISKYLVPMPPSEQQNEIAIIFKRLHEECSNAEKKAQLKSGLFQSMLQNLVTGQHRVPEGWRKENGLTAYLAGVTR